MSFSLERKIVTNAFGKVRGPVNNSYSSQNSEYFGVR